MDTPDKGQREMEKDEMRWILVWCLLLEMLSGCNSETTSSDPIGPTRILKVPSEFATIQQAINESRSGDTIRVAPGFYPENLTIDSKAITLLGAGRGLSIIQGFVIFKTSQGSIKGFTVTGGTSSGIYLVNSNMTITGNGIDQNTLSGIKVENSTGLISDNQITNNGEEGVLVEDTSGLVIGGNTILNNRTDGITLDNSSPTILDNIIQNNGADGISIRGFDRFSAPLLTGNKVHANGSVGNFDIVCLGPHTNPTGNGNQFGSCFNCSECAQLAAPGGGL